MFFKNTYLFYLTLPDLSCGMQDLQLQHVGASSLTGARTLAPCTWEHGVLATEPPGKSLLVVSTDISSIFPCTCWPSGHLPGRPVSSLGFSEWSCLSPVGSVC